MTLMQTIWENLPSITISLILVAFLIFFAKEVIDDNRKKLIEKIKDEVVKESNLLEDIQKEEEELWRLKRDVEEKEEKIRKLKILVETKYGTDPTYKKVTIAVPEDTETVQFSSFSEGYSLTSIDLKDVKTEAIKSKDIAMDSEILDAKDDDLPW